jgi:N-acetylglucosamine kinase-like BadF-type ATPase
MKDYYLGVDIGSTNSHALITDQQGNALGFSQGGPGNHEVVGYQGLESVLSEITHQAMTTAGIHKGQISGAGFGVSGYDWPTERIRTLQAVETLGLQAPLEIVNDALIGLIAGAKQGWGVAVVAGTGENCWGRALKGRTGRVTGGGTAMGEYGGAYSLVMKAIQAVSASWSKRGPDTELTQAFIEMTKARSPMQLLEGLVLERYSIGAEAAKLVFQVAAKGDQVAVQIITWAGMELGSLANGVIRQLRFEDLSFEVVMVGRLFDGGQLLIEPFRRTIHTLAPKAQLVRLDTPPAVGAVLLGMEQAGMNTNAVRQNMIVSMNSLLK